jgi:tRNA dimethylallyltransferase
MDKRYNKSKILILGVTAVGKGTLAFDLAGRLNAEIISVDSMKVYRRMDIGTAKPNAQRRRQIPYHLIDVVEPSESFSVDRFLELTQNAVADIQSRGKTPIASGGTAMYIKALLYGLFEAPPSDSSIRDRSATKSPPSACPHYTNVWPPWTSKPPPASTPMTKTASSGRWKSGN